MLCDYEYLIRDNVHLMHMQIYYKTNHTTYTTLHGVTQVIFLCISLNCMKSHHRHHVRSEYQEETNVLPNI